ncbi:AGE2 [Candida theae]|uniref:AGE2 n=1 Tax=Candida theae TaxID=1198502 RepID=A0AAD5B957_9ASCO|nr:AGE2 [Candida theae]KAI5948738.1 AGE2 [Candida theae]
MGTHISKVKSVDLDAWTDDQIENIVQWGNAKCNGFWEAKLPEGYVPDQSKIENFIRTKYDLKKWSLSSTVPNPASIKAKTTLVDSGDSAAAAAAASAQTATASTTNNNNGITKSQTTPATKSGSLLDDDFGLFTSHKTSKPALSTSVPSRTPPVGVTATARAASATPVSTAESRPPPTQQLQSAQSTGGSISSNSRPDLKKSILSLYASPSASNSFVQSQQQSPQYSNKTNTSVNSLSDSLAGLQFQPSLSTSNINNGGSIYNKPQAQSTGSLNAAKPFVSASTPWNSEWNDSSSSSYTATSKSNMNSLDDDLFKNVWS